MYHTIVRHNIRRAFDHLNAHDYNPVIAMFSPHIIHSFAGDSAMGGKRHDIDAARKWYPRLFRLWPNLRFEVVDIIVQGLPWDTRAVVRFNIFSTLPDGQSYTNTVIQFIRLQWGQITTMHLYEDTQKLAAALQCLADHGNAEAIAPPITN